jgi:hypothetical protein
MSQKSLNTLVEDIYGLFNPDESHTVNEENLRQFTESLAETIRIRFQERISGFTLRFSNLGKQDRQIWYDAHGFQKEELSSKTYFKFLYGDIIEALLLFLAKEAGHDVTDEQKELSCLGVKGHIDAKIDGVVVDVKSASPFGFQKFKNHSLLEKDPFGYIQQLSGYSTVETPGEKAAFLACDKVSADLTLMTLSPSVIAEHPPEDRIKHLQEVIASDTPPEKCFQPEPDGKSGNMKLGTECSYCAHKFSCWPEVRTFIYSTGPRYLIKVVKTPEVYEVN